MHRAQLKLNAQRVQREGTQQEEGTTRAVLVRVVSTHPLLD